MKKSGNKDDDYSDMQKKIDIKVKKSINNKNVDDNKNVGNNDAINNYSSIFKIEIQPVSHYTPVK